MIFYQTEKNCMERHRTGDFNVNNALLFWAECID